MSRTAARPIPRGRVEPREALILGLALGAVSLTFMALRVNFIAAALLALTIAIYIPFYTMGIKRRTPQNIVWGGAAGALPPVIGWAAAANSVSFGALALFLIIFLWTPPHFWSLALRRSADYERVGVPMLPNVVGPVETCRQIAIYAAMLIAASFTPLIIPRVGLAYGLIAAALDAALMWRVLRLYWLRNGPEAEQRKVALGLFGFSILYLFALFVALGVTAIAF
jgi:protoheme IX farnesyltransferase